MNSKPELFGLFGFTHGWGRLLTVMSPQGASATVNAVGDSDGLRLEARDGRLPRYYEVREGALNRLIKQHGIAILSKTDWDERKQQFGDVIYR